MDIGPFLSRFFRTRNGDGTNTYVLWDTRPNNGPLCTHNDRTRLKEASIDPEFWITNILRDNSCLWPGNIPFNIRGRIVEDPTVHNHGIDRLMWMDNGLKDFKTSHVWESLRHKGNDRLTNQFRTESSISELYGLGGSQT